MSVTIQVTSINGEHIIALWEADGGEGFKERQTFYLEIECEDQKLIKYVNSGKVTDCLIDEDDLSIKCRINQVFHYLNSGKVTTFVKIIPDNRDAENILLYIYDRTLCSDKFIQSL